MRTVDRVDRRKGSSMSRTALRLTMDDRAAEAAGGRIDFGSFRPTLAIVCGVPDGLPQQAVEDWLRPTVDSGVAVTWTVPSDDVPTIGRSLAERSGGSSVALRVPRAWSGLRGGKSLIRRRIEEARRTLPAFDSLVIEPAGTPSPGFLDPSLADHGITAVCSDTVSIAGGRTSRRPAPRGWDCRSPVWGLWEFRFGSAKRNGWIGGLVGLAGRPRIATASLTVIATGAFPAGGNSAGDTAGPGSQRQARQSLERTVQWASRLARQGIVTATLSDVSALLSGRESAQRRRLAA